MHPFPTLSFNIAMIALTLVLIAGGAALHHRGGLASRGAVGVWVVLCGLPLVVDIAHAWLAGA